MDPELAAYYLSALSDQPPLAPIRVSLTLSLPPPPRTLTVSIKKNNFARPEPRTPTRPSPTTSTSASVARPKWLAYPSAPMRPGKSTTASAIKRGAALGSNGTLDRRLPDAVGVG